MHCCRALTLALAKLSCLVLAQTRNFCSDKSSSEVFDINDVIKYCVRKMYGKLLFDVRNASHSIHDRPLSFFTYLLSFLLILKLDNCLMNIPDLTK